MKVIATEKAPAAIGPYSQAYVNNGVLYTSGQLGINPETGNLGGDTIEKQQVQITSMYLKQHVSCLILLISEHSMKFMQNISHLNRQEAVLQ